VTEVKSHIHPEVARVYDVIIKKRKEKRKGKRKEKRRERRDRGRKEERGGRSRGGKS
jgi:hypothetical protein